MIARLTLRFSLYLLVITVIVVYAMTFLGRFLPESDQIAFMYQLHDDYDIYLMDVQHGVMYPLIASDADERYPEFSPDGTQLAYHSNVGFGGRITNDIYIFDMEQQLSQIFPFSLDAPYDEAMAEWSPDGQYIGFHSDAALARGFDIYVSHLDGAGLRNLIQGEGHSSHINWSPDGKWIAFSASRGGSFALYILNLENGFQRTGLNEQDKQQVATNAFFSDWSPDSTRIVYASDITGQTDLYIVDINGENRHNITNTVRSNETHPLWLDDGRIMFSSDRYGDWDIFVMDADGGHVRRVTSAFGNEEAPTWQRHP